ncbi:MULTISPECIES: energy transducer TonB [unclassified Hahella]|uniref:energy transducer TonB n=1 Tax=unclassified Hahella TaxID=2624107 RepID=UPI001C1EBB25|nr:MULTISPECIES: energy transducer TonB [unclassified Hahella]MBU6954160.1 energy transducer TonB [Hahella sp. HN01]MDG9668752.1 energy transducer TonB [Hahella sp. CR1]
MSDKSLSSPAAGVTAFDRLGFCMFFAIAVHAAIVLGITFTIEPERPVPLTVEVTLAQFDDKEEPEDADFLAQSNQKGSGSEEDKKELTTTEQADFRDIETHEVAQLQPEAVKPREASAERQVVANKTSDRDMSMSEKPKKDNPEEAPPEERSQLLQRSLEIASLEAKLSEQQQAYAKRPRVTRLTAVSARKTASAYYMEEWRRELERIGNINYPEEARKRKLEGKVRVAVIIEPDGQVQEINILSSSGAKILDDAVVRIIRLAEPFPPFTEEMRKESDLLEIIRTFSFGERMYATDS